jgi:hypothetical protein
VLRLMRKGVRADQNVNLLRWSRYYGIDEAWNMLWGFPGETKQDYTDQQAVVPHLAHLQPPGTTGRIWMERFSPLFTETGAAALRYRRPEPSYGHVYPAGVDLERIAYFFEYEFVDALPDSAYEGLQTAVGDWQQAWEGPERPRLTYWSTPGFVQIYDARRPGEEGTYTFSGPLADIYRACSDRASTAPAVRDKLGLDMPVEEVREAMDEYARRGLMFTDGTRTLSLALPAGPGR